MCGRYSITTVPEAMRTLFRFDGPLLNLPPRYNVAPTQDAPVVVRAPEGGRQLTMMRWGLVPSWSKEGPSARFSMHNARAETVAEKPAYRSAFRDRRCLVPADGYYEWEKRPDGRQPYRYTMSDGSTFAFAGLWDRWKRPDGTMLSSFTIIVTEANALAAQVHDRMPVILDRDGMDAWMTDSSLADLLALLKPFPADRMAATPVSRQLNKATNEGPELIEPVST